MIRTALSILSTNALISLVLFARNLIVAHQISVEDYGIAATFAVAMAVVEMMSALGLQQQIVQAKDGDDPHFQAALHGFQVLRGVIAGAALFVISGPLARFLGIGEIAWAYQWLALIPVLNGFQHFDIYRLSRQMRFGPMLLSGSVPALLSVLAVWPFSLWFGDYRVMLFVILLQSVTGMITSHLTAERPYRLSFDTAIMARSLRFGWPILVNGILMFLVFQGDKMIVGRELGMVTLGVFAMGMTLTLTPTLIIAKSASNFFLPQLSRAAHEGGPAFQSLSIVTLQAVLSAALMFVAAVAILGPTAIDILLGAKFGALHDFLMALAVSQALRVSKAGPAIVALALGRTANPMIANLPRVLTLPLCWYVAATSGDIHTVIWIAAAGEIAGYALATILIGRDLALWNREVLLSHIAAAIFLLAALGMTASEVHLSFWEACGLCLLLGASIFCQPQLRTRLIARWARGKK